MDGKLRLRAERVVAAADAEPSESYYADLAAAITAMRKVLMERPLEPAEVAMVEVMARRELGAGRES